VLRAANINFDGDPYGRGILRIVPANFNDLESDFVCLRITFVPPDRPSTDRKSILHRTGRSKLPMREVEPFMVCGGSLGEGRGNGVRATVCLSAGRVRSTNRTFAGYDHRVRFALRKPTFAWCVTDVRIAPNAEVLVCSACSRMRTLAR
jgi:hypothetical protein